MRTGTARSSSVSAWAYDSDTRYEAQSHASTVNRRSSGSTTTDKALQLPAGRNTRLPVATIRLKNSSGMPTICGTR